MDKATLVSMFVQSMYKHNIPEDEWSHYSFGYFFAISDDPELAEDLDSELYPDNWEWDDEG